MVGVLIIAHGPFAEALISSATHVMGKRPLNVTGIAVTTQDKPDPLLDQARRAVAQLDAGQGVVVLTDMVGGTPSNIATRLLSDARVAGIAGANLPMLVRLLTYRNEGLARAVHKALLGGSEGVALLAQEVGNAASRG